MNKLKLLQKLSIVSLMILAVGCSTTPDDDFIKPVGVLPISGRKIVTYYPSYGRYTDGFTAAEFLSKSAPGGDYSTDEFVPSFFIIGDGATRIGGELMAWKKNQFGFDDVYAWGGLDWNSNADGTLVWSNGVDGGSGNIFTAINAHTDRSFGLAIGGWPKDDNPSDPLRTGAFNRLGASPSDMTEAMASMDHSMRVMGKLARVPNGFHVDFEFPLTATEGQNLLKFCQALKTTHPDQKLSIALGPNKSKHLDASIIPYSALNSIVDNFELMTYDYAGSFSGQTTAHHTAVFNSIPVSLSTGSPSNYSSDFNIESVVNYVLAQGIPAKKILIGVALYGRFWTGVDFSGTLNENSPYYPTAVQSSSAITADLTALGFQGDQTIKYTNINALSTTNGWESHFDNTAKAAYVINKTKKIFITYDNVQSIAAKASLVKAKGLGGVIVWDATGARGTTILKALRTELDK